MKTLRDFIISGYSQLEKSIDIESLTHLNGSDCIHHLMHVSAGMDSMMLGETQITAQIKSSFSHARTVSGTGPILNRFIQFSLEAGKRVRTETNLSAGAISVSYAAVEKIGTIFPDFSKINILLIGAGSTGKLTASHFMKKGATQFYIANRRAERGKSLADETNGHFIPFEDIPKILPQVQIVVTCTSADFPVVTTAQITEMDSINHSLLLMDLSVPRNIQTDVDNLKNITLFTVDELESVVSERLFSRKQELPRASRIVNEVYDEFATWLKTLSVTPTIADLKHLFEDIKNIELSKIETRYDEDTLSAIDKFSSSLMRRILKDPISSLKSQATNGHYSPAVVDAIRSMYRLDDTLEPVDQD
tara:strand:- start:2432 stop:3517 length:1086 start_codon:yes stop_codon:yes gene_type:complete